MRVLQLIDSLNAGGAEKLAVSYANTLTDMSIDSFLCTTRCEGVLKSQINYNKVNYSFLKKRTFLDVKALIKLHKIITQNKITHLHAHGTSLFFASLIKIYTPNLILIWHNHYGGSLKYSLFKTLLIKICAIFCNGIIVINKEVFKWTKELLKFKNVIILNNYPDISNKNKSTHLRGFDNYRIIYLANLRPEKNHQLLIKSFKEINKIDSKWSVHLVGKDRNDDYSSSIKDLISKYNLDTNVFIYGECEDVSHILSQCEIGIIASNFEGLPLALLEYGASKLAVISSDVGECLDVIGSEENGIVIPSSNTTAMTKALHKMTTDDLFRRKSAVNFNKRILTMYSKVKVISQLISFYKSLN